MGKRVAVKNFLDTYTSFLKHESTTGREWTLPDRSGEIVVITGTPAENDVMMYIDGKWQKQTLAEFVTAITPLLLNP
jgi:hypothetical protein